MVLNVTSSILQPLFGYLFDRTKARFLVEVGISVNCIGMALTGIVPDYNLLLLAVGTAGLGHAAFHPPAFSTVTSASATSRGRSMSIFTSGGNVGSFLGPFLAGVIVTTMGREGLLLLLPTGLATAALLFRVIPHKERDTLPKTGSIPANKQLLALLICITAFRSITIQSSSTFLPLFLVSKGNSLLLATSITSFWLAVGVVGQLAGGFLSDRIGERPVIVVSLIAGAIVFYGFLVVEGSFSLLLLMVSATLLYASWSVIVVMSCEAAPSHVGTVTGLMLGFSVGVGGLASTVLGALADMIGLASAFTIMSVFALVGGLLALLLPSKVRRP